MKKIKNIAKGIIKGLRDAAPIPSKAAENETAVISGGKIPSETVIEMIAQKLTSRGVMVFIIVYLIDMLFTFGLFS